MLVMEVTNMKESIIKEIEQKLLRYLDNAQMEILHKTLTNCLDNVDISIKNENFEEIFDYSNIELIEKFISSKEIEGCSVRTIKYYKSTLEMLDNRTDKHFTHMTTDHLRKYLTDYQKKNNCSKVSIDNIRRNLSSFLNGFLSLHQNKQVFPCFLYRKQHTLYFQNQYHLYLFLLTLQLSFP